MPAAKEQTEIFTEQIKVIYNDRKNWEAMNRQNTTSKYIASQITVLLWGLKRKPVTCLLEYSINIVKLLRLIWKLWSDISTDKNAFQVHPFSLNQHPNLWTHNITVSMGTPRCVWQNSTLAWDRINSKNFPGKRAEWAYMLLPKHTGWWRKNN